MNKNYKLMVNTKSYKIYFDKLKNQYIINYNVEVPISKDVLDSLDDSKYFHVLNTLKKFITTLLGDIAYDSLRKFKDILKNVKDDDNVSIVNNYIQSLHNDEEDFVPIQTKEEVASQSINPEIQVDAYSSIEEIEKKFVEQS